MKTIEKRTAQWFRWIGTVGLILSLAVFLLYLTGILESRITPADSSVYWAESSDTYLSETGLEFGSGWIRNMVDAYFMSSAALAILASTALPTLLILSLTWFHRRDYLYGVMAILISVVLAIAIIS